MLTTSNPGIQGNYYMAVSHLFRKALAEGFVPNPWGAPRGLGQYTFLEQRILKSYQALYLLRKVDPEIMPGNILSKNR